MDQISLKSSPFHPAQRVENYKYAIRNIVAEAKKLEAEGREVTYLNIGDPVLYGFQPPEELIEAKIRALRAGYNGYSPSTGAPEVTKAIAEEALSRGIQTSPADVAITYGASEAADLVFTALLEPGDAVLVPAPSYPLYTAIAAKLEAIEIKYNQKPENGWHLDIEELRASITPKTRAIVVINPNNPTGALYPPETLSAIIEVAREYKLLIVSDEVYHHLTYERKHVPLASLAGNDVPVITIESISKNYMAPGWRLGWLTITNSHLVKELKQAIYKLADARLCAPMPSQHAIKEAMHLNPVFFRKVMDRLREQRDLTYDMLNSIDGMTCNKPEGAFYAMAQIDLQNGELGTDEQFILALLRATGILYVHGSGFGKKPHEGFFRLVFLPDKNILTDVYKRLGEFVVHYRESKLSAISI
ncbi:aminotransferase class I and II [Chloroherpeton thalassium ATCC 35110]|uniref:alanine transaminase n=1 Tax=Chloroherpeton thalassium (strain ATCC 35110 / GB-78) TaxID=517418 RepID=B3QVS3_CHLT3|nr:aminotransferase class I/II-fold pyridoxal phosphate-dependent enzyme [Chloroherpeton thalassium]ACF13130.1 aminotransferase class I and II [Chloroherpeton thalassium ATCC 35110]